MTVSKKWQWRVEIGWGVVVHSADSNHASRCKSAPRGRRSVYRRVPKSTRVTCRRCMRMAKAAGELT